MVVPVEPKDLQRIDFLLLLHPVRKALLLQLSSLFGAILRASGAPPDTVSMVINVEDPRRPTSLDRDENKRFLNWKKVLAWSLLRLSSDTETANFTDVAWTETREEDTIIQGAI